MSMPSRTLLERVFFIVVLAMDDGVLPSPLSVIFSVVCLLSVRNGKEDDNFSVSTISVCVVVVVTWYNVYNEENRTITIKRTWNRCQCRIMDYARQNIPLDFSSFFLFSF